MKLNDYMDIKTVWDSACPNMSSLIISDRVFTVLWNNHLMEDKDDIAVGMVEFDRNNAGDFKILNTVELNTQEIVYLFQNDNIEIFTEHKFEYERFI